jgi:hypothetical protein
MIIVSFPHPLACSQRSDERHREPAGSSEIPAVLKKKVPKINKSAPVSTHRRTED